MRFYEVKPEIFLHLTLFRKFLEVFSLHQKQENYFYNKLYITILIFTRYVVVLL